MSSLTVGFYGMTHLGIMSAVACADKNVNVIVYDPDEALVKKISQGEFPIEEPELYEKAAMNQKHLTWTVNFNKLLSSDLIYVAIDVPTNHANQSDLKPIQKALDELEKKIDNQQIVIVLSQVNPGFMRSQKINHSQLFYQVETLVFGQAFERASKPERFIIGCSDPTVSLPISYRSFLEKFSCPLLSMKYESAELAKIAINMYLVSSVMTTNFLTNISRSIDADWDEVVPSLRLDKRIGPYAYLNPGLGISGGNLERDMMSICRIAESHDLRNQLLRTWLEDSEYYKKWVCRQIESLFRLDKSSISICILGVAYKADTHSIKNSPSILLIHYLKKYNVRIQVHDRLVDKNSVEDVVWCDALDDALRKVDLVVVMTEDQDYKDISPQKVSSLMAGKIIIDPFEVFNRKILNQLGISIVSLKKDALKFVSKGDVNVSTYA